MLVAAILFAVSSIGSGFAFSIYDFIAWRLLGGLGVGLASVIAPAYIAECSPANLRGRLGSLQWNLYDSGCDIDIFCCFVC
jgi:SP family sugar:H+ symporter-like MFS transporter